MLLLTSLDGLNVETRKMTMFMAALLSVYDNRDG